MSSDSLHDRGRALEEAFFARKNRELLEALREKEQTLERRAEIESATGIGDANVLDQLLAQGIDSQSINAIMLVPLVQVAWADRTVEDKEREAVLSAAEKAGIEPSHSGYSLLENWLDHRPGDDLFKIWAEYVAALNNTLDAGAFQILGNEVFQRAKSVASAAGGILGVGKISDVEQKVLDGIKQAFHLGS